jgi:type IV secretory pathway TraG/TraD family ATPase VirD4
VVPGIDKMLAMGRGLGFMFYLGFQEVAGLRPRIGDAMYSLLGNANLQILMRLQPGLLSDRDSTVAGWAQEARR